MKFCVQIPCGCGSVLLWKCFTVLCTSGSIDDVMFGYNGCDAERWLTRAVTVMNDVAIPGQSLMSINACLEMSLTLITRTRATVTL